MTTQWLACLCLAALLAGCSKPAADSAPKKPDDVTLIDSGGVVLTESEFNKAGKTWPLTVPEAAVGCTAPAALWAMSKGRRFGLNEWATASDGFLDLRRIQKVDQKAMDAAKEEEAANALPEHATGKKKRGASAKKEVEMLYVSAQDLTAKAQASCVK